MHRSMVLVRNKDDVPEMHIESAKGNDVETKSVYGKTMSMMYAVREEGYHSAPHAHDSEQFNFCIEGKAWIFIEDEAILMGPGDFSRVPELAVHWAFIEEGPCTLVEAHSPPYVGDEEIVGPNKEKAVGLFDEGEDETPVHESFNIWCAEYYADNEEEMMEEFYANAEND